MVSIESELFSRLVKARSLPHPTARRFDRQIWEDAIASIEAPSSRDYQLCSAAIHFGREIQSLRSAYEPRLFRDMDKRTGVLLSIAMANYNFLILIKRAHENAKQELRKKDRPLSVGNQGAGFGLVAGGARVVDFHFLRLYLTDGDYHAGLAFNFAEKKGASRFHALYGNEREAEENFEKIMARPPTLNRFLESAMWETTKFPMSSGGDFEIAICNFNDRSNREARELVNSVS
jgi:hypothetical protein